MRSYYYYYYCCGGMQNAASPGRFFPRLICALRDVIQNQYTPNTKDSAAIITRVAHTTMLFAAADEEKREWMR